MSRISTASSSSTKSIGHQMKIAWNITSEQMKQSATICSMSFNCQHLAPQPSLQVGSGSRWATSWKSLKEILSLSHKLLVSGRVYRKVSYTLVLILISFAGLWFGYHQALWQMDLQCGLEQPLLHSCTLTGFYYYVQRCKTFPDSFQINKIAFCINTQDWCLQLISEHPDKGWNID